MLTITAWTSRRFETGGGALALALISALSFADQPPLPSPMASPAIEVVETWRTRRYGPDTPFSKQSVVRAANQREVVLVVEVGGLPGDVMNGPEVYLTSNGSRWRAEMTVIGQPAGDPLGVNRRKPLFLFKVPSNVRNFTLHAGTRGSVAFTANRRVLWSLE